MRKIVSAGAIEAGDTSGDIVPYEPIIVQVSVLFPLTYVSEDALL